MPTQYVIVLEDYRVYGPFFTIREAAAWASKHCVENIPYTVSVMGRIES